MARPPGRRIRERGIRDASGGKLEQPPRHEGCFLGQAPWEAGVVRAVDRDDGAVARCAAAGCLDERRAREGPGLRQAPAKKFGGVAHDSGVCGPVTAGWIRRRR
ncbi:hypothetical protein Psuf_032450 [Phytohabitans suffuscus]|uniref:Uncharacterized protein n=1 Tax=Phytohabitans suffuscus TaxID=624315 RepID=A0A6F8YIK1_9ACTN|nr:hypothetical protein Psuf_032450 [Phytohabitans suffuscus]